MGLSFVTKRLKMQTMNRNGFTFLTAIFMVTIIGIMLGLTGQSWKTIMKREREKELLFRGSQIKEAIENWNNQKYKVAGKGWTGKPHNLVNLEDLLDNPHLRGGSDTFRYLPQNYAAKLDDKDPRCAPNCPKLKIYQDPMTGKEWTIIRGSVGSGGGNTTVNPSVQGATVIGGNIIGVASKSDEEPLKTDFKDTALENMGAANSGTTPGTPPTLQLGNPAGTSVPTTTGSKLTKYSEWKFIAESPEKNDHSKIYRAYHERW
jgi:type II secretory pathway pseudopilin PulG